MTTLRFAPLILLLLAAAPGCGSGDDAAGPDGSGTSGDGGGNPGDPDGAGAGGLDGAVPAEHFSFFVTSLRGLQDLSDSELGFGGDLTFGETGEGAGLRGADGICAALAERSMPGAGAKPWRAFLSTAGLDGDPVNAIDRIGDGPWYDRLGRLLAPTKADLMHDRPENGDATIADDFPNEDGVPNHQPDPTRPEVDNHDFLTGTGSDGRLYAQDATCADWTGATGSEGRPRVGHSWPRFGGPGGGGGGDGGNDPANWMSSLDESGCAPGVSIVEMGPPDPESDTVGSGGGYGGFYCFALTP